MKRYVKNGGLFADSYFERVLAERRTPVERQLPDDASERLALLREIWEGQRGAFVKDARVRGVTLLRQYEGLPEHFQPIAGVAESDIENGFVRPVVERVLGYAVVQNRTMRLSDAVAQEVGGSPQRPDLVLFSDDRTRGHVLAQTSGARAPDGVQFCKDALFILDAKRFDKGVGADEDDVSSKRSRKEPTAIEDVLQVDRYMRGYDKPWGVLTNGRCWRLMHRGRPNDFLRFDLVLFLEDLREREPTAEDLAVFGLFWNLFGQPAVGAGYLDAVLRESEANTRKVRDILREQAHRAVEEIARGFWSCQLNAGKGLDISPTLPAQAQLDHLREVSLTFLYRLLFILKAEAQELLSMRDALGSDTRYAQRRSTRAIFAELDTLSAADRDRYSDVYEKQLLRLFRDIDSGNDQDGIPAYNGGLFDDAKHPELARWKLVDGALHTVLKNLIYLEGGDTQVPYADLDVRDLGDMYEGLLEQRLIGIASDPPSLHLKNQKGERKASGSYFTPDGLVDHLVRKTVGPFLDKAGDDANAVLSLRVLDPAMGSGHFLVKVVDVMADHLTVHCDPEDPDAPRDNGPKERAYWKRKVVESCVYGVDYNPMAVELARVALWLYTAEYGKPLSFLDHHLKVGTSLVGATVDRLARPGLRSKAKKAGNVWEPVEAVEEPEMNPAPTKGKKKKKVPSQQLELGFSIDTSLLSGILASIRGILEAPSNSAADVRRKSKDYAEAVGEKLAAHRLLADLWCLQWFSGDPTDETILAWEDSDGLYAQVKKACGLRDDKKRKAAIDALAEHPLVRRVREARAKGYGPRPEAYFHFELEFPEVAFDAKGKPRGGFGFDAIVGNPPWDRIRPERRQFYGPWGRPDEGPGWDIANTQATSLEALIGKLQAAHPELERGWLDYERDITDLNRFLRDAGLYRHQVVRIDGKKTGGDPDTFRYFTERMSQALRPGGRMGIVVPGTLWQAEGCTGLRRLLFDEMTVEELFVFENYRKWAFFIHSSFKFTTLVASAARPPAKHEFAAAFMLRDLRAVWGQLPERMVRLSKPAVEALSPGTLALLDLQSDGDARLVSRLHEKFPTFGSKESGWGATYRCDLHMTNDAWRFKHREWMKKRGFLQVVPERQADGTWRQVRAFGSPTARYPDELPQGGEYWVAADADWYRQRGYVELEGEEAVFVDPVEAKEKPVRKVAAVDRHRIVAGGVYTALYEGRMVHNFDHAQKAYVSGEARMAKWDDLSLDEAKLTPRTFVLSSGESTTRIGFCNVTGATNERSMLATLLPSDHLSGNSVPTLRLSTTREAVSLVSLLNSFVGDALVRLRVSLNLNWTYVSRIPVPKASALTGNVKLAEAVAKLSCTTPELADVWNEIFPAEPWTYASAERDEWKRAELRADIDAAIADAYGLSVAEYARVLTGFPLLDRNQPALPGDFFVTESDKDESGVELKPRSFITRDFALFRYMKLKGYPPPGDLAAFFRDEVGIDPDGPLSRFRIGECRDLIDRVDMACRKGAVAYVPSGRGGPDEANAEEVEADEESENAA